MVEVDNSIRATIVYKELNYFHVSKLECMLFDKGFEINESGHVYPRIRPENYPKTETGSDAPVGYLKRHLNGNLGYFNIQHLDKEELIPYAKELFDICESIKNMEDVGDKGLV